MSMADPHELDRFVSAQEGVFDAAIGELQAGRKRSHWMWFVFPQLRGLGRSAMAQRYGIASLEEASAYLAHPLLGPRLERCTEAVLGLERRTLAEIFGSPDDMKFVSSMTLFASACDDPDSPFRRALLHFSHGRMDLRTVDILRADGSV